MGEWYLLGAAVAGVGGVGLPGVRRMVDGVREEGDKGAEDGKSGKRLWWAVGGVVVNGLAVVCFAEGVGLSMWVI